MSYFRNLFTLLLLLQASPCFAQDTINISVLPVIPLACTQLDIGVAVTQQSTLGIIPSSCNADRVSTPTGGASPNIRNQFNRVLGEWKYAPDGAFNDGFFVGAVLGIENDQFNSPAGSTADVYFAAGGVMTGYQWFWENGFNITWVFSAAHLEQISLNNYNIVPSESIDVINWLQTNTSSNTHFGMGPILGWAF